MSDRNVEDVPLPREHTYACLLVHGAPVYVLFADREEYDDFVDDVKIGLGVADVLGQDGSAFHLRVAAVDAIFPGKRGVLADGSL